MLSECFLAFIEPSGACSIETIFEIPTLSFKNIHLNVLFAKWQWYHIEAKKKWPPFCRWHFNHILLTLKWLGHIFQNLISFSDAVHLMCNIFIWNWSNTMNVYSALWILMAWCFSTRASVATVLTTHPCISRCLRVKWKSLYFEWISLMFLLKSPINKTPAPVQIMAWHWTGNKALYEPLMD